MKRCPRKATARSENQHSRLIQKRVEEINSSYAAVYGLSVNNNNLLENSLGKKTRIADYRYPCLYFMS
ncbi:hypothetical protein GH741_18455 [Aquibacillus halophilus]|uniref:Uncharacterized protein n=1 Tax=Aquibacillus halophilus TaxID=930132 RepID=A0A6A8DTT5_9BACI|nr:hypothetical protein [Aquibacillus halophilus]